jgi:hypothetical protein
MVMNFFKRKIFEKVRNELDFFEMVKNRRRVGSSEDAKAEDRSENSEGMKIQFISSKKKVTTKEQNTRAVQKAGWQGNDVALRNY